MVIGFINTKISNKDKLLSLSNLPPLFYQQLPSLGKMNTPHFLENKQNSNPNLLCNVGEIQLWLIKTTCFTYFLLQIKPVIIKTLNVKFENLPFSKLQKKKLIRHVIYWQSYNLLFQAITKEKCKIYKIVEFFTCFHLSFYFEELYSHSIVEKYFMNWYSLKHSIM